MKQIKKDTSIKASIDPNRSSHLDALLESFFQSNKFDKKRLDFSGSQSNKNSSKVPLNNNSTSYSTLVHSKQSSSSEQQQQQPMKNNSYPFSSSDSDDNAIEQFRPKGVQDDSASNNKQQQQTSQKKFVKLYQQDKIQSQKDLTKNPSSSLEKSDSASLDTKSSMSPNDKQQQEQGKACQESKSIQPDDIEQDLQKISATQSEKRSQTQSSEQLEQRSPSKKQLQQNGSNHQNNELNLSKQVNSTGRLSDEQQSQQDANRGQGKNQIQDLLPLSASCSNNQLPARQQFSMKDILNQHRQGQSSNQKSNNTNHSTQHYSQEDIEIDEESENYPLRNNLSSNIKQLFKSKSANNDSKIPMQKYKNDEEQESLMAQSSFTLKKLSPKTNSFETKSRKIFQDSESDDDDDDEDRDEVEALKELARNYKQQDVKLQQISNSAPVPCMNGINSILSQFEDKEKGLRQEKLNFEKVNKDINGKSKYPLKKSDRMSGKVSDIKKLNLQKASSQNVKRSRYEYEEEDEEEDDKCLKPKVFYNEESQDISSDYVQNDFEFGQGGKMKNKQNNNSKDQEMQKKLGLCQDPKKKRCLEKHKIREEDDEEEEFKRTTYKSPLTSLFKTDSKSQKKMESQNSTQKQDSKGKSKKIVDSDEEYEVEKKPQNSRNKQTRRKPKKINEDIESSCTEHSQKNDDYYDDSYDSFIDDNPQFDENELFEKEMLFEDNNPSFKSKRLLQNSQKSQKTQSQKQSLSYPSLQQLLSQKEKFSEFLENPYQPGSSPSSQKKDQQLSSVDQGERKTRKKLVKAAHIEDIANFQCTICLDQPTDSFFGEIDCQHRFCFKCIFDWSKVTNQCPMCRMEFSKILKRNFNGTVSKNEPYTFVRRKKQKINENDYIEEAQALQDEEDRQADQPGNSEPTICYKCLRSDNENLLLICDVCDENYCHTFCDETLRSRRVPEGRWACHFCRF